MLTITEDQRRDDMLVRGMDKIGPTARLWANDEAPATAGRRPSGDRSIDRGGGDSLRRRRSAPDLAARVRRDDGGAWVDIRTRARWGAGIDAEK